jgi:folate-binding protein YgfZ
MDDNETPPNVSSEAKIFFYLHREPGFLRISGKDRLSFLQRQTTNDLELLSPGQSLVTVLTSPAGRILDVLWVLDEEESFGVLTLPGKGRETFNFLQSRIFFMDKVTLEDASQEYAQIDLFGDEVHDFLLNLTNRKSLEDGVLSLDVSGVWVRILYKREFVRRLLVAKEAQGKLLERLQSRGAEPLAEESYEILRVETGLPAARHELTEEYTPLETGFDWAVSDNKGCYTGQEVIARQINYDKVTRKLVGLKLKNSAQEGDTLFPTDSHQPIGKVTTIANSPRFGQVALAIIKRPFYEPGNELVAGEKGKGILANTTELPFK